MVHVYSIDFRSIVILQQYSGARSKYGTCVTVVQSILNIPLILTTILTLTSAYEHLLMYKLYLSSFFTFILCKRIRT